ncbi:aminotransferase DegT [Idiomarina tyrosinivorans]|uniref:Aminotransferase DegT n=1 Tax=Idiomarina tyrosinivorans TaxID=1445662 RepID=A0A432ZQU0_9GAMM|nr:DegT/DnrJ/EryC1/StrS family aminotransferase [Idiomarina tyrosinivorans]RUO80267.1 aminotransferase DegT [Idiomarina tyrosinivorans]
MIPVTKPYLPDREKLDKYIDGIYEREWLTNNGPLVQELTKRLEEYLGVENLMLVSNGTLALQIAYRALGVSTTNRDEKPEAITTPFTFVATASSLKWEGVEPVFADIDSDTWCLDPKNIEKAITPQTKAIVPVHVFGNACEVEAIDEIAKKHDLKVIYDAAHAFGVNYKGESLLQHGDAAILSFHATKLFHTIEGGAIVFKRKEDLETAKRMMSFGITGLDNTIEELGINAKMNEFQAAMGLANLEDIEAIIMTRRQIKELYNRELAGSCILQKECPYITGNGAYVPIVLDNEKELLNLEVSLKSIDIYPRRYFSPSLDSLKIITNSSTQKYSNYIASRILCLPIYVSLSQEIINLIINVVKRRE